MTFRYALFVFLTLLLSGFLTYSTYATARLLSVWRPSSNPMLEPADNLLRVGLAFVCVALGWLSGVPFATLGWTLISPLRQTVLGIVIGLFLAIFFYITTRWVVALTGQRFYSTALLDLIAPHNQRELIAIALALVPSVLLEELLFRSLWIGGFSPIVSPPLLIVTSSLLFGLMHKPQGVWGMIGAGMAGVLFGGLFLWTGSLLLPLVAHYTANLAQLAAARHLRRADAAASDSL